jgi:hypothetical protein
LQSVIPANTSPDRGCKIAYPSPPCQALSKADVILNNSALLIAFNDSIPSTKPSIDRGFSRLNNQLNYRINIKIDVRFFTVSTGRMWRQLVQLGGERNGNLVRIEQE